MKRVVVSVAIVICIVGGGVWYLSWLKGYTEDFADSLIVVQEEAEQNPAVALEVFEALIADWEGKQRIISMIAHEHNLNRVDEALQESFVYLAQGRLPEFQWQIQLAAFAVSDVYQKELPTLQNVL